MRFRLYSSLAWISCLSQRLNPCVTPVWLSDLIMIWNSLFLVPSCLLASAQVGSHPLRIITACMTVSTRAGGLPYVLISVMSFLFSDSRAWRQSNKITTVFSCADENIMHHIFTCAVAVSCHIESNSCMNAEWPSLLPLEQEVLHLGLSEHSQPWPYTWFLLFLFSHCEHPPPTHTQRETHTLRNTTDKPTRL